MGTASSQPVLDQPVRSLPILVPALCDHCLCPTARPLSDAHVDGSISFTDALIYVSEYAQLAYAHKLPPLLPRLTSPPNIRAALLCCFPSVRRRPHRRPIYHDLDYRDTTDIPTECLGSAARCRHHRAFEGSVSVAAPTTDSWHKD